MQVLSRNDLELDLGAYAERRAEVRAQAIELKKQRRVHLGDIVTLVFENRDTIRFQVQEMLFAERITDPDAIQVELDTYNPLMPASHSLSATLFLEIPDMATLKEELPRLVGIEHSVRLTIGDEVVPAVGEEGRSREDYTSTVHYLRFPLTDEQRDAFRDPAVRATLSVVHENYTDETTLADDVRRSLIGDLAL